MLWPTSSAALKGQGISQNGTLNISPKL